MTKPERKCILVSDEVAEAVKEALINAPDEGIVRMPERPSPPEPHAAGGGK